LDDTQDTEVSFNRSGKQALKPINDHNDTLEEDHSTVQSSFNDEGFCTQDNSSSQDTRKRPACSPLLSTSKKIQINPLALVQKGQPVSNEEDDCSQINPRVANTSRGKGLEADVDIRLNDLVWASSENRPKLLPAKIILEEKSNMWMKPGFVFIRVAELKDGDQWVPFSKGSKKLTVLKFCSPEKLKQFDLKRNQIPATTTTSRHFTEEHKTFLEKNK